MKQSVAGAFHAFSKPLEGRVYWLYLDVAGLVSTGVGFLVNDLVSACALPWRRPSGELATRDEVVNAWSLVKQHQEWAPYGGGHRVWQELTALRIDDEAIDHWIERKLGQNEAVLVSRFPDFDDWPADAQLALHSWAWAVGPRAGYPMMSAALRRGDFDEAANECKVTFNGAEVGTLIERNRRNQLLFRNAERVRNFHLDPETLYWPDDLAHVVKDAPTEPELPAVEDDGGLARRDATSDALTADRLPFLGWVDEDEDS